MPVGFLAPWFLGGLALVGGPLLVHLTRRDRATPTAFPSLMFVRRLPQPTTKRRRLRDPLLLLKDRMLGKQLCGEAEFKRVEQEVSEVVAGAVRFADESPFHDAAALLRDVLS